MKELGIGLILVGVVSLVLPLLGMKFMFLTWIEQWGSTVAWLIRGGLILLGLALWFGFRNRD